MKIWSLQCGNGIKHMHLSSVGISQHEDGVFLFVFKNKFSPSFMAHLAPFFAPFIIKKENTRRKLYL